MDERGTGDGSSGVAPAASRLAVLVPRHLAGGATFDALVPAAAELAAAAVELTRLHSGYEPWIEDLLVERADVESDGWLALRGFAVRNSVGSASTRVDPCRVDLRSDDGELDWVVRLGNRWRLGGLEWDGAAPPRFPRREPRWRLVLARTRDGGAGVIDAYDAAVGAQAHGASRPIGIALTAAGLLLAAAHLRFDAELSQLATHASTEAGRAALEVLAHPASGPVLIGLGALSTVFGPALWKRLQDTVRRA